MNSEHVKSLEHRKEFGRSWSPSSGGWRNLPRLANSEFPSLLFIFFSYQISVTRTGWYVDPFVVISFGKKVFRTRVISHSRSPVGTRCCYFTYAGTKRRFTSNSTIWNGIKTSSNEHVDDAGLDLKSLSKARRSLIRLPDCPSLMAQKGKKRV